MTEYIRNSQHDVMYLGASSSHTVVISLKITDITCIEIQNVCLF